MCRPMHVYVCARVTSADVTEACVDCGLHSFSLTDRPIK